MTVPNFHAVTVRLAAICCCTLPFVQPTISEAQTSGTIRGRVIDNTGQAVPHAELTIAPGERRLIANSGGQFTVQGVPFGVASIRVRRVGYQPYAQEFPFASSDTTITITMSAVPAVLDSVRIRERRGGRQFTAIVVDDADTPVAGAEVIPMGMRRFTSDSAGRVVVVEPKSGTLLLRVRKIGYRPYFGSLVIEGFREDTIRLERIAQGLDRVTILEESGFGRDTFVFAELESRTKWKANGAGTISREELESFGDENLCSAMPRTRTGVRLGIRDSGWCSEPVCLLINGERPLRFPLSQYRASDVEAVEYFPRGTDWSRTIFSRAAATCYPGVRGSQGPGRTPGGWVLWLRKK